MGPRLILESPKFATESEREVWELLAHRLRPDDVVLANVRLTNRAKDHEADLIVLMPGVGIVVVEVKGGGVWIQDGGWHQSRGNATVAIDPVEQVRGNKYAVREDVEMDSRWRTSSRSRVRWAHSLVFPYSQLHESFAMPDCPRWSVQDRGDLPDLARRLQEIPAHQGGGHRAPSKDGEPSVPLVPLVLDHNLRNTKQIGDVFNPLAPMRMRLLGSDAPEVEFVPTSAQDAIDTANDQVDRLLEAGWRSHEVMLLTTGRRHPVQIERGSESDLDSYGQSFWDEEDVFYGHVLGCKGLERRAVVLCINEGNAADRSRERLTSTFRGPPISSLSSATRMSSPRWAGARSRGVWGSADACRGRTLPASWTNAPTCAAEPSRRAWPG
jgi:hypothetical protein